VMTTNSGALVFTDDGFGISRRWAEAFVEEYGQRLSTIVAGYRDRASRFFREMAE
jgi:hypothetical protein